MIDDNERREVAEKLRERTKKPMGKSMQRMFTETLGMYTHNICWMNPDKATSRWDVIVNYLADLIDRPTCTIVCEGDAYGIFGDRIEGLHFYELSCGHIPAGFEEPEYCPKCGAVVVDEG